MIISDTLKEWHIVNEGIASWLLIINDLKRDKGGGGGLAWITRAGGEEQNCSSLSCPVPQQDEGNCGSPQILSKTRRWGSVNDSALLPNRTKTKHHHHKFATIHFSSSAIIKKLPWNKEMKIYSLIWAVKKKKTKPCRNELKSTKRRGERELEQGGGHSNESIPHISSFSHQFPWKQKSTTNYLTLYRIFNHPFTFYSVQAAMF